MLKAVKNLPGEITEDIYNRIKESVKSYTQNEVYFIWNEAWLLLIRQKKHCDADWAMKGERLSQLERFAKDIKPCEAEQRQLFSKNQYELYYLFENEQVAEHELTIRQQEYIRTLYMEKRFAGILSFAASTTGPILVGAALAHVELADEEFIDIAEKLESANEVERAISEGFFKTFCVCNDEAIRRTELIENYLLRSNVLALFKLTAETIHVINGFSKNAKRIFWKNVNVYTADNSVVPLLSFIISNLTAVKRFDEALFILSRNELQVKDRKLPEVVYKMLKAYSECDNTITETYYLQRVITWFQRIASREKVLEIEWKYLNIMEEEQNCKPIAIFDEMSNNPRAFIDVLRCAYNRSDFHGEESEAGSRIAEHCFSLLWKWKQVPGSKSDGSFSIEAFFSWIAEVITFLEENGMQDIGMECIGETLFHAPADTDFFLNKDIAMFLQKDKEGRYRRGYEIEALNSVETHEINRENLLEYKLEKEYLSKADQAAEQGYFRLSETLRSIATELHTRGDRYLKE
ncbi:MAG: hypothetical protein K6E85_06730 [Lachnospiraceae bacterium]|nr:hypothetical protein [Lachnospiraceae bacterium]